MTPQIRPAIDQVRALATEDEVLVEVAARCRQILATLEDANRVAGLEVLFVDFARAEKGVLESIYHTDSCRAVLDPPTIVVSAGFLLELEAAFRSFDLSESLLDSQYLRSDGDLFGLVRRIGDDPRRYVGRLRRVGRLEPKRDRAYIIETLTMTALFFIAHELGHLLDDVGDRNWATFLRPDAGLERRLANAVLKLCRHTDELAAHGFDLPGFDRALERDSDVRRVEQELGADLETLRVNHATWFADEVSADETGTRLLVGYLQRIEEDDPFLADQLRYVAVKGLFTAALYTWSRDLLTFFHKIGPDGTPDARALVVRMVESRETYIRAASLFGDVHRFTLLRGALATEAIIRSGSDFFDRPGDQRSIWWSRERTERDAPEEDRRKWWERLVVWRPDTEAAADRRTLRAWWLAESLQRYYLLCIHMDTAVKIATMGCSTGWMLEADRRRASPQLFVMNFEPIDAAVDRLRRLP